MNLRHYRYKGKSISYALRDQIELIQRLGGLVGTDKFRVEYVPARNRSTPSGQGWLLFRKGMHEWSNVIVLKGRNAGRVTEFCTDTWKKLFGTTRRGFVRIIPLRGTNV